MNNTRKKAGRPKGAVSFVDVTLGDLQDIAGSRTVIPVSRVWWEKQGGVVNGVEKPSANVSEGVNPKEVAPPIEISFD